MSKTLGFFLAQLLALMIIYPLWVRRSFKLSFWRWLLVDSRCFDINPRASNGCMLCRTLLAVMSLA